MRTLNARIRILFSILFLLCTFFTASKAFAASDEPDGLSSRIGADLLIMRHHDKPFYAGNIPTLDIGIPFGRRYAQMELGWAFQWGFTKFYVDQFPDFLPSLGLRLYPFGKFLSIYGKGKWGTFIFNNSTVSAEFGGNIDIKTGNDSGRDNFFSVGAGYFTRRVGGLGNFVERDRHDQWYITSKGFSIHVGFLIRALDGS
ncbi:MAG: hypothetical protein WC477_00515 [Patescibacteria group bacterium]